MGLILWCFLSVFTGHETVLISPQEMEMNPAVWFSTLSQHSARDTFVSSSVIQTCIGQLQKQVPQIAFIQMPRLFKVLALLFIEGFVLCNFVAWSAYELFTRIVKITLPCLENSGKNRSLEKWEVF